MYGRRDSTVGMVFASASPNTSYNLLNPLVQSQKKALSIAGCGPPKKDFSQVHINIQFGTYALYVFFFFLPSISHHSLPLLFPPHTSHLSHLISRALVHSRIPRTSDSLDPKLIPTELFFQIFLRTHLKAMKKYIWYFKNMLETFHSTIEQ